MFVNIVQFWITLVFKARSEELEMFCMKYKTTIHVSWMYYKLITKS